MEIVDEKKEKKINIVLEVSIFAIIFGCLLALIAYFAFTGLNKAPDLWGFKRSTALGTPLVVMAAIFFLSGILLLLTRAKIFAFFVLIGGILLCGTYALFEITTTGLFGSKLMSILSYTIAVAIIIRAWNAVQFLSAQSANKQISSNRITE